MDNVSQPHSESLGNESTVWYHGTRSRFDRFSNDRVNLESSGWGTYFTSSPLEASRIGESTPGDELYMHEIILDRSKLWGYGQPLGRDNVLKLLGEIQIRLMDKGNDSGKLDTYIEKAKTGALDELSIQDLIKNDQHDLRTFFVAMGRTPNNKNLSLLLASIGLQGHVLQLDGKERVVVYDAEHADTKQLANDELQSAQANETLQAETKQKITTELRGKISGLPSDFQVDDQFLDAITKAHRSKAESDESGELGSFSRASIRLKRAILEEYLDKQRYHEDPAIDKSIKSDIARCLLEGGYCGLIMMSQNLITGFQNVFGAKKLQKGEKIIPGRDYITGRVEVGDENVFYIGSTQVVITRERDGNISVSIPALFSAPKRLGWYTGASEFRTMLYLNNNRETLDVEFTADSKIKINITSLEIISYGVKPTIDDKRKINDYSYTLQSVKTFDELYTLIEKIGFVQGSSGIYTAQELIPLINDVRRGRASIDMITRTLGLRDKVQTLINQDKINVDNQKYTNVRTLRPQGIQGEVEQGGNGNCYFVSALYRLKTHPQGAEKIGDMIRKTDKGYQVRFYDDNGKEWRSDTYTINDIKKLMKNEKTLNNGQLGDRLIERAYNSFVHRKKGFDPEKTMLGINAQGRLASSGGFMHSVYNHFFGREMLAVNDIFPGFTIVQNISFYKEKAIYNLASLDKNGNSNVYECTDIYGNKVNLYFSHAYAIQTVDLLHRTVEIVNPHNTKTKRIRLHINDLSNYFSAITVTDFR